jgi:putative acetyltransferase
MSLTKHEIDQVTLRPAMRADGAGVSSLLAAVFAEYDGCVFAEHEFPEHTDLPAAFRDKGGVCLVAEHAGAIVATGSVVPAEEPGCFEIKKVYLAAALRGGGLAQTLLAQLMHFAAERGARHLRLWSDTRFIRGHAFYAKLGFVRRPGTRVLHDVSHSLEFGFEKTLA